jgi:hypothetical protein
MRNILPIRARVFRGSTGRDDTGDRFCDDLAVSRKIVGRMSCVETVAEIFVVLRKQRVDHWKTHSVD